MYSAVPKIGGSFGKIRASIDIAGLNEYLLMHAPPIRTPIGVKQFKVRFHANFLRFYYNQSFSLVRYVSYEFLQPVKL
jgi:hypothetical protein